MTPIQHAVAVTTADGRTLRLGPDEADPLDVPISISFETELPGGFGPATITLPRQSAFDRIKQELFAGVRVYDANTNQTIYEGRVTGTPGSGSSQLLIECEGWSKHLEDNHTMRFLGIDASFERWGGTSTEYKLQVLADGYVPEDGSLSRDPSDGVPALALTSTMLGTSSQKWERSMIYDAAGLPIGAVDYAWRKTAAIDEAITSWHWNVFIGPDSNFQGDYDVTAELRAAGPGSGTLATTTSDRTFALVDLNWSFTSPNVWTGADSSIFFTMANVIGAHGLTLYGTGPAAPNTGRTLHMGDVVAHLVKNFAPLLNYTTGVSGSIQSTSFGLPHCVFYDDTTVADALQQLVLFGGSTNFPMDWFVYENRQFNLKEPNTYGTTWRVRLSDGVTEATQGPDASTRINGIKVSYTDGAGSTHSVGPPGSDADFETGTLADLSADNPANADGARHWESYAMSQITSKEGAVLVGALILADRNRSEWRGDLTLSGTALDDAGIEHPVARIRAGDRIIVEDDRDIRPRRVVNTSYSDIQTLTASCGAQPDKLDVLLARLGIVLVGRL